MALNPNRVIIDLNNSGNNATGIVTCSAYASYIQKAEVYIADKSGTEQAFGVFQGTGEDGVMTLPDGSRVLNISNISTPATVIVNFLYSSDGGESFTHLSDANIFARTIVNTNTVQAIEVVSKDHLDSDANDTLLTISCHASGN